MTKLPSSLERLIRELGKLPGIGQKSAQRLAFYLLKRDNIDITGLATAIAQVKSGIVFCSVCHNMAEADPCNICADEKRDHSLICVVEEPLDAQAIDKSGQFKGVYHILGGVLNPLEGIGADKLKIESLIERIRAINPHPNPPPKGEGENTRLQNVGADLIRPLSEIPIKEIIIATNPSLEGETTAMHLAKLLKEFPEVKVTRIARGLPMGSDLEYADDITLMRAMEGRREY